MAKLMRVSLGVGVGLQKSAELSGFEKPNVVGYGYVLQVYGMLCRVKNR
ncbi:hypothetical protein [Halomonas sp. E14]